MNKIQLEKNINEINCIYKNIQKNIQDLQLWIKKDWEQRVLLDEFLDFLWLEKNEESRYAAYSRIANLKEESLILYIEKNFNLIWEDLNEEKNKLLDLSYKFTSDFHSKVQLMLISIIEEKELLTPFFLELMKSVLNIWLTFNELFLPRRKHIIRLINRDLENEFINNSDKIINFLNKNNLFDLWHNWNIWDRSYSSLIKENWLYKSKSYYDLFKKEIDNIVYEINLSIDNLSSLEDGIYNSKELYINYLNCLKEALKETNINNLINKWSKIDEIWMEIKTPFQISHPLEYYEDKYRKSVSPEWDLRIQNNVFESNIKQSILNMFEIYYKKYSSEKYKTIYNFSKENIKKVQLYLSSPILYFGSELTWLFSAQVVPNDEIVSKKYWKKIFAFPEMVLKTTKSKPFMKIDSVIFDEKLLQKYKKIIFWKDEFFYKIYDISTIWHEYWHNLWMDIDTQILMDKKTWVFKNIEEFKATTWWLVAYFILKNNDIYFSEKIVIEHIYRCINLLKFKKVNEIIPYYCESLIHLQILFESWIINFDENKKIKLNFDENKYEKLKELYYLNYEKLIKIYLDKIDAWEFLNDYVIKEELYYLPKNDNIKDFVNYYYSVYKKIWNDIFK